MTGTIQIRNIPDALHRRLKSRAALAGMSLSDYLLSELRHVAGGRRFMNCEPVWSGARE
jgi:antitoxin FitA